MSVNDPNYDLVPEGTVRSGPTPPHLIGEPSPTLAEVKTEALLAIHELVGLRAPSAGFKPFRYPWAYDLWKKHENVHWLAHEVPLGEDVKDWERNLSPAEKNLLTHIFRLFVKGDQEVADNYMDRLGQLFRPTEVRMMLSGFGGREALHIDAYALLLETIGMPESEYEAFAAYEAMKAKVEHWHSFRVDTDANILKTLAMFGGFAEGLQVFASFAMLMNFPRHNKMKGMGQIVAWSVRDESIHCEGIIQLFHAFAHETGAMTPQLAAEITDMCRLVVDQEDVFIDLVFEMGDVEGMTAADVKAYIRFIADWRLRQLGLQPIYGIEEHPLPWLQALLSGQEHANFFEARATAYSKAGTKGSWTDVWDRFDQRPGGE